MTRVRVHIVDAAADQRDALAILLDADPRLSVVGVSSDASSACRTIPDQAPSIVLVDRAVPELRALVQHLMVNHPVPIVLLMGADGPGEDVVAALAEGALSAQLRPGSSPSAASGQRFRDVVRALSEVRVVRRRGATGHVGTRRSPSRGDRSASVVAVAASTGGPTALQRFLAALPDDLPVPVLVVQHLAVGFSDQLTATLRTVSDLPVHLATEGAVPSPGTVYLAPDEHHLVIADGRLRLLDDAPIGGFRPSATALFSSVAAHCGDRAIAVVLSGMGSDGLQGLQEVHDAGGTVLAQDEATSVVFGMPGAAVSAGVTDLVAPVERLAAAVAARLRQEPR